MLRGANTVHRYESKSADMGLVQHFVSGWRNLTRQMATTTISKADACFDEEDFLDSAADAFVTVNELVGEGDLESLRPLLSDRLHAAISTVRVTLQVSRFNLLQIHKCLHLLSTRAGHRDNISRSCIHTQCMILTICRAFPTSGS